MKKLQEILVYIVVILLLSTRMVENLEEIEKDDGEKLFVYSRNKNVSLAEAAASDEPMIWPSGDYCIFMGDSSKCPHGFRSHMIRLSVPRYYDDSELATDNTNMIHTGAFGHSELLSNVYDNRYSLRISTCCKQK